MRSIYDYIDAAKVALETETAVIKKFKIASDKDLVRDLEFMLKHLNIQFLPKYRVRDNVVYLIGYCSYIKVQYNYSDAFGGILDLGGDIEPFSVEDLRYEWPVDVVLTDKIFDNIELLLTHTVSEVREFAQGIVEYKNGS